MIIGLGVAIQVAQLAYSIWKRKTLRDTNGDLWNGRTLEWSVPSPAPHYNFARLPIVTARDAWWEEKQNGSGIRYGKYEDFELPKNTDTGIWIGLWSCIFGFAVIWHLWWLAPIGVMGIIWALVTRLYDEDTVEVISASEAKKLASQHGGKVVA